MGEGRERQVDPTVADCRAGDEPLVAVLLAEGLQEKAGDLGGGGLRSKMEGEGGRRTVASCDGGCLRWRGCSVLRERRSFRNWRGGAAVTSFETRKGVGLACEEKSGGGVGTVVGMVAAAQGIEVPLAVLFRPQIDLEVVAFASGGQEDGVVFGFVEGEVGKKGFFCEFFSENQNVLVEAMMPVSGSEKELEGVGHE